MRRVPLLLTLAMVMAVLAGCGQASNAPTFGTDSGKVKVAASFYPLYEFAKAVGGDKIDLINLVPPGVEPHDWEPKASHMKTLNQANLFIYNGVGMEHWVAKTLKSLDNKSVLAVESASGFTLIKGEPIDDGHGHAKKDDSEVMDPHIWLDPQGAIHQVKMIRDALMQADGANKAAYEANAETFIAKLSALDEEFRTGLMSCQSKEFFTTHAAFGYLASRYNLEQHAIMGLSPDAEPKPRTIQRIVEEAKEHNVKYIFFETLVSDKVANVVAKEIGAQTLILNPFEGLTDAEIASGQNYLTVMRQNLTNLETALECK